MKDGERHPQNNDGQISDGRKGLYYFGGLVQFVGMAMFLSNFLVFGCNMVKGANGAEMDPGNFIGSFFGLGFGGFILIVICGFMRKVGARGLRGSGILLDPQGARQDLKPFSKMAGGMFKDTIGSSGMRFDGNGVQKVMVRCLKCNKLNEDDSKFCQECGQVMTAS